MTNEQKTNEFIHRMAQIDGISDEQYRERCVPNYDSSKGGNHQQKTIDVGYDPEVCKHFSDQEKKVICSMKFQIEVDEKLAELLTIINQDRLITEMSCQYDYYGYSGISFSVEGYNYFMNKLKTCIERKYGTEWEQDDIYEKPDVKEILNRLTPRLSQPRNNKVSYLAGIFYDGTTYNYSPSINWQFYQEDIPTIVAQLKTILAF